MQQGTKTAASYLTEALKGLLLGAGIWLAVLIIFPKQTGPAETWFVSRSGYRESYREVATFREPKESVDTSEELLHQILADEMVVGKFQEARNLIGRVPDATAQDNLRLHFVLLAGSTPGTPAGPEPVAAERVAVPPRRLILIPQADAWDVKQNPLHQLRHFIGAMIGFDTPPAAICFLAQFALLVDDYNSTVELQRMQNREAQEAAQRREDERKAKDRQTIALATEIAREIVNPLRRAEAFRLIGLKLMRSDPEEAEANYLEAQNITFQSKWISPEHPQKFGWLLPVLTTAGFVFKKALEETGLVVFNAVLSFAWLWLALPFLGGLKGIGGYIRSGWRGITGGVEGDRGAFGLAPSEEDKSTRDSTK
jgi:hypothetical protein